MAKRTRAEISAAATERRKLALKCRKEGMTYKQIGVVLGVGGQRARAIVQNAIRLSGVGVI